MTPDFIDRAMSDIADAIIGRTNCPNVLPDAVCVDPECPYCKTREPETEEQAE
jgi:hypothetical protein